MISLERPFFLLLILPIPLIVYFRYFWPGRGGRVRFSLGAGVSRQFLFRPRQRFFAFSRIAAETAFWSAAVCLILGLVGVSRIETRRIFLNRGMDIFFVLDESPSMSAKDFPGNRFEAAKKVISEFIDLRENDAVGLISVGGNAALRVPPTMDYRLLKERLDGLRVGGLGNGTALGRGLSLASFHLKNSDAQQRIVILLTDGENTDTVVSPYAAASVARELGIRVYAVGIGSPGAAEFEYKNPETGRIVTGFLSGGYDDALLKSVAERTGGEFYTVSSVRRLSEALKKIDSLEMTSKSVKIETESRPLMHRFLTAALFLFLISFFIKKLVLREIL